MRTIRIDVMQPDATGYDVVIESGALRHLDQLLQRVAPAHRYAVIADRTVASLWGDSVLDVLVPAGLNAELITFAAGEANKTRATWAEVTDRMLERGFGRDCCVLALGGGVVGDLAGFVAATYLRGVPLVQLPTTLLAMIDASVGGKTGVDAPSGKNLVGAFYPPCAVVADPRTLRTLPRLELSGGLAEAIKHGAIADAGYLDWIADCVRPLLGADPDLLVPLIQGSVTIKARFVSADLREQGARAALNFGHTIAHALERLTNYELHHGHAVSIGMVTEAWLGELAEITAPGSAAQLAAILEAAELPVLLPSYLQARDVIAAAATDKKARAGKTRFVLLERIGAVARGPAGEWTFALPAELVRTALQAD